MSRRLTATSDNSAERLLPSAPSRYKTTIRGEPTWSLSGPCSVKSRLPFVNCAASSTDARRASGPFLVLLIEPSGEFARTCDKATGIDAAVYLVGGETLARSYAVVKKGGVLATTVQPIDESAAKRAGIRAVQVIMTRKTADLAELARLVEEGVLKPRLSETMNLSQAREAQEL